MKHSITKICADSLRAYLNDKHSIKLKSGHAHEIVAAFFGYKSRIALLADRQYSIDNLEAAEFIILNLSSSIFDQRVKSFEGLYPGLPPSNVLAEAINSTLIDNKGLSARIYLTFRDLALSLAEERWHSHKGFLGMDPTPQWLAEVEVENNESVVLMTVSYDYLTDTGKRLSDSTFRIKLPRVAGTVGYGVPEIMPTFYSGQMSDPDFRLKIEAI